MREWSHPERFARNEKRHSLILGLRLHPSSIVSVSATCHHSSMLDPSMSRSSSRHYYRPAFLMFWLLLQKRFEQKIAAVVHVVLAPAVKGDVVLVVLLLAVAVHFARAVKYCCC